jgi:hypothetical protein
MSVAAADICTPMSVDKSSMTDDQKEAIKNDRDRFFDVVLYQADILNYLKIAEVSWTRSKTCSYL